MDPHDHQGSLKRYDEYSRLINQVDESDTHATSNEEAKGTVMSSVFNLSNSAVGVGILALPFAISQCGIVLGPILMVVMATLMSYTLMLICQTSVLFPHAKSYEQLVKASLGKHASYVMAGTIIFQTTGSCTTYMITIADSATPILQHFLHDWHYAHYFANRFTATLLISIFLVFPLALQKQLTHLKFSSTLSIGCVCYIVFVVIFRSLQHVHDFHRDDITFFSNSGISVMTTIPIIVFAFRSHTSCPPIHKELRDNGNMDRVKLMVFLTLFICSVLYYITGIFGYLEFLGDTKGNILQNFSDGDSLATVARFLMTFVMVFHYPVVAYTTRSAVDYLIFGDRPLSNTRHIVETLLLWAVFFAAAMAIPNITAVLGLAGAFPFTEFLFPSLFLRKFHTDKRWQGLTGNKAVVISWCYTILAGIIAVVCSSSVIYKNWIHPVKEA